MTDVLMNDSTADISTNSQVPNQSMSTDSEESFLIKQLNKSQLFNSTQSSGTGSNSAGNTQRRSFFRESYIDEDGALKSFSVYQDVINETSDESRDISLSGLSLLNMENVITGREPQNSHLNNILSEVDANQGRFGHRKSASVSRTDSLKDPRQTSKRMSGSSFRISAYATLPHSNTNTGSTTGSEQYLTSSGDSYRTANVTNPRSSSFYSNLNLPGPVPRLSEIDIEQPLQRVPTPDYAAPPPPSSDEQQSVSSVYDEVTMDALTGLGQIAGKQRSSSTLESYKSARSLTRASILNFEETRRKQKGIPHLIQQNAQSAHTTVRFHDSEQFLTTNEFTSQGVSEIGVTPSIHSPSSEEFQVVDDASIRNTKRAKMYSGQSLVKKELGLKEFKLRPPSIHQESHTVIPYYKRDDTDPSDPLLEKLQRDRENRPERYHQDTHSIAWLVYFVSFLVPPLFFFLGLGLLDTHIGAVDVGLKRISLLTGTIVLMVTLAMIGVGFGVGITQAG